MFEDISKVILLSDLDGTLLSTDKKITDIDRRAIERFTSMGGRFTVATGRTVQSFEQFLSILPLGYPIIMYNGAAIHDYKSGKTLYTHPLPVEARSYVEELLELMPEAGGEVLKTDGTYVFSNTDYQQLHTRLCDIVPNYAELEEIEDGGWLKVLFSMSPEDVEHMGLLVKKLDHEGVDYVKSSDIFLEMLPSGVSKGSALAEYRKLSGMEGCTFVSVGDFDNDIEMIVEADLGACPANAEKSVKEKADLILDRTNDEGAVSELIEYIIERCRK
ncbi:Cof-type HAD-IIB family hydrolase [Ruminococcus sp.]|uniref:Cof-type HAD-IIB family hydrolase n=1 Tax=Ruminococcus sp. TaxID=41978 RepID=UPI0025D7C473|nr:Cof-type HAD-IIB family hydrolase [Ruminococcus sp.]